MNDSSDAGKKTDRTPFVACKNPLLSIVVPVYNAQSYLEAALHDLQNQTYDSFEVIVIDDASQDESISVAQRFARADSRFRVIQNDYNQGSAQVRNRGILEAKGDYISFFDPDDRYEPDLLACVSQSLARLAADVVLYGHTEDFEDSKNSKEEKDVDVAGMPKDDTVRAQTENETGSNSASGITLRSLNYPVAIDGFLPDDYGMLEFSSPELWRPLVIYFEKGIHFGYPWNKFYRLDFIKKGGYQFPSLPLNEDFVFNIDVFRDVQSLNLIEKELYHYVKREGANLTNRFVADYFDLHRKRIELLVDEQKSWDLFNDQARGLLGGLFARYIISALERNCDSRSGMSQSDRKTWVEQLFTDNLFNELIPYAQADSAFLKVAFRPLQRKSVSMTLCLGSLVHVAKRRAHGVFQTIRSKR